jgi:NADH:ubiquinone reductase (H+-translocating)
MTTKAALVVIVGGGFGGLAAAKELKCSPVEVLLIDCSNHHVFQPLLYQVATSVLAPGQIASPIRSLLAEQANASVMLGNVTGSMQLQKQVIVDADDKVGIRISYDYLILATGATHSYFGHDEFAAFAPELKSLADAESLRNHSLEVFEEAEIEDDPDRRQALMTFVMVGAGRTGVEMASAIAVMTPNHIAKRLPSNRSRVSPHRSCGYGVPPSCHIFEEAIRSREAALDVAWCRCPSWEAGSGNRQRWRDPRR